MHYVCMFILANWQCIFRVSYTNLKVALLNVNTNLYIHSVHKYPFAYILDNTSIKMLPFWKAQKQGTHSTVFILSALFLILRHLLFIFLFLLTTVVSYRNLVPNVFLAFLLVYSRTQLFLYLIITSLTSLNFNVNQVFFYSLSVYVRMNFPEFSSLFSFFSGELFK